MSDRPEWWCKDYFLGELERTGGVVRNVCKAAAEKADCKSSANTLYSDVLKWRRRDEKFLERYDAILADAFPGNASRFVTRAAKSNAKLSTQDQYVQFFEVLVANNFKIRQSCEQFGIAPGHVLRKLNPDNPHYDEEFTAMWELAEGNRIADIYDRTVENALEGGPVGLGSDSAQRLFLTNRAPFLFPEKRRMDIKKEEIQTVEIGPRLLAAVQDRFKALNAGNGNGGEVIDLPQVRVLHGTTSDKPS